MIVISIPRKLFLKALRGMIVPTSLALSTGLDPWYLVIDDDNRVFDLASIGLMFVFNHVSYTQVISEKCGAPKTSIRQGTEPF
jgi:hypothetical protein